MYLPTMRHIAILLLSLSICCGLYASAADETSHVYPFPTDTLLRGYYNRPYERYEAEPDYCLTNGTFLAPTDDQRLLQSEASHQQALTLTAEGDYVAWTIHRPGDGLTIRFSLPDSEDGTGTEGTLDVYAGEELVGTIPLSSYWAWQYCTDTYPDNTPKTDCVIRMRFDETHLQLSRPVASGEQLRLVKSTADNLPYTIDFIELEPVPEPVAFESLTGEKVCYEPIVDGQAVDLQEFINTHGGKTIYLPAGRYEYDKRLYINADNTRLIGAGMWHTELYFSAPSDNSATYSQRGIETNRSHLRVEGLYINTANRQRYYDNDNSKQVGKAFMGSWGKGSVISHCWAEHFECGAWIADYSGTGSDSLLVEHCRFRNHYADGINCSHGSTNHTIRYCSFRNNGDDDMASWTTQRMCRHITYAYCTAENNWRASSLGFFGGTGHYAHHIVIFDGLECGVRINADFSGRGFADSEEIYLHDITVVHCGCIAGQKGTAGDFWGNRQGAVNIGPTAYYPVQHLRMEHISVQDSRRMAFYIAAGANPIADLHLRHITIDGAATGITFYGARGDATYCDLLFYDVEQPMTSYGTYWTWTEDPDCTTPLTPPAATQPTAPRTYDILGRTTTPYATGIYIVSDTQQTRKILRP